MNARDRRRGASTLETVVGLPLLLLVILITLDIAYFFSLRLYAQWVVQSFVLEASKTASIGAEIHSSHITSEETRLACRQYRASLQNLSNKYERMLLLWFKKPLVNSDGVLEPQSAAFYVPFKLYDPSVYKPYTASNGPGQFDQTVGYSDCSLAMTSAFDFLRPGERNIRQGETSTLTSHPSLPFTDANVLLPDHFDSMELALTKHPIAARVEFVYPPIIGFGLFAFPVTVGDSWYEYRQTTSPAAQGDPVDLSQCYLCRTCAQCQATPLCNTSPSRCGGNCATTCQNWCGDCNFCLSNPGICGPPTNCTTACCNNCASCDQHPEICTNCNSICCSSPGSCADCQNHGCTTGQCNGTPGSLCCGCGASCNMTLCPGGCAPCPDDPCEGITPCSGTGHIECHTGCPDFCDRCVTENGCATVTACGRCPDCRNVD